MTPAPTVSCIAILLMIVGADALGGPETKLPRRNAVKRVVPPNPRYKGLQMAINGHHAVDETVFYRMHRVIREMQTKWEREKRTATLTAWLTAHTGIRSIGQINYMRQQMLDELAKALHGRNSAV
ncbi:Uncharacterized protein PBTT_07438 [Plasmodiophora brassicae]